MEVTITFKLNAQEIQRSLDAGTLEALVKTIQEQEESDATIPEAKATTKALPELQLVTEGPTEEPITLEAIRAAFMAKNAKGNAPRLKAILDGHGVRKVSDLKEEDYPSVLEALEAV